MNRVPDCRVRSLVLVLLASCALCLFAPPVQATIRYEVSVAEPEKHTFRVKMIVPEVKEDLTVQLPAWNALYQIRDFAYRRGHVSATRPFAEQQAERILTLNGHCILFAGKTPNTDVHVWSAEWKDTAGSIVMYSLRYDSAVSSASLTRERPDNSDLEVTAIFIPAAVVSAMRKELGITEPIR